MPRNKMRLRVAIQQPALPKYRVPLFSELSRRFRAPVRVFTAHDPSLPRAQPDGFVLEDSSLRSFCCGRLGSVMWDSGQWSPSEEEVDVLVLNWNVRYLSLLPSLLRARRRRVATVLWGHGYSKQERLLFRQFRDTVTRWADALLFYDEVTAQSFRMRCGTGVPVFVAPNSLDQAPIRASYEYWAAHSALASNCIRELRVHREYVLFVSRLLPENNLEVLLKAIHLLSRRGQRVDLVVVGTGSEEQRLRNLTRDFGLESQVHMLGAVYDEHSLGPWFLNALALCYPSNLGLTLHHAFGYGLPVIAGDRLSAHNPEIHALRHEENGLLTRHLDSEALARAISRLSTDSSLRIRLGQSARRTVTEHFGIERMADGFEEAVRTAYG